MNSLLAIPKYKRENLKGIFRHNERRNRNYSNNNRQLQNAFYDYMVSNGFELERGLPLDKFKVYKICKMQKNMILLT